MERKHERSSYAWLLPLNATDVINNRCVCVCLFVSATAGQLRPGLQHCRGNRQSPCGRRPQHFHHQNHTWRSCSSGWTAEVNPCSQSYNKHKSSAIMSPHPRHPAVRSRRVDQARDEWTAAVPPYICAFSAGTTNHVYTSKLREEVDLSGAALLLFKSPQLHQRRPATVVQNLMLQPN